MLGAMTHAQHSAPERTHDTWHAQNTQQPDACTRAHRAGQLEYSAPEVLNKPLLTDVFHQVCKRDRSKYAIKLGIDVVVHAWVLSCVMFLSCCV